MCVIWFFRGVWIISWVLFVLLKKCLKRILFFVGVKLIVVICVVIYKVVCWVLNLLILFFFWSYWINDLGIVLFVNVICLELIGLGCFLVKLMDVGFELVVWLWWCVDWVIFVEDLVFFMEGELSWCWLIWVVIFVWIWEIFLESLIVWLGVLLN